MTDFEQEVVAGLARVEAKVDTLTDRMDRAETARETNTVAHAERFGRVEATLDRLVRDHDEDGAGAGGSNGATDRAVGAAVRRYAPRVLRSWATWIVGAALAGGGGAAWRYGCVPGQASTMRFKGGATAAAHVEAPPLSRPGGPP